MASSRMSRLMAWVARVWRSWCGGRRRYRPSCRGGHDAMDGAPVDGAWSSAISRFWARMCSLLVAVQAAKSTDEVGCRGMNRSLRSLPTGIRSQ